MSEKVKCSRCGAEILARTSTKTGGLCMPCKQGTREQLEASRAYYLRERELEASDPFRSLWRALVAQVHAHDGGFEKLSEAEQLYFSVGVLEGEVYNGGFDQYFFNSSGALTASAEKALEAIGATESLALLRRARSLAFDTMPIPSDTASRRSFLRTVASSELSSALDALDHEFWKDRDQLGEKLQRFARENNLVAE